MELMWLNSLPGIFGYLSLRVMGDAMIIPDYIAISVLMVLIAWAVWGRIPRGKL
jgi:hypothetical protein